MQVYFVRHGQSTNNHLWSRTGNNEGRVADPELTGTGQKQAEHVAAFLSRGDAGGASSSQDAGPALQNVDGFGITHVYASLMIRAVATGHAIASALGLPLHGWVDLHEEGGIYLADPETGERRGGPGQPRSYFEARFPELLLPDAVTEEGWYNKPFEEAEARVQRARRVLDQLQLRHGGAGDRVVLVSHGGFFQRFMLVSLGLPDSASVWFAINNASVTRLDFEGGGVEIAYTNRVDFLPRELIT